MLFYLEGGGKTLADLKTFLVTVQDGLTIGIQGNGTILDRCRKMTWIHQKGLIMG